MICLMMVGVDDDKVVIKKIWMIWKVKYVFWVNNLMLEIDGLLVNFV